MAHFFKTVVFVALAAALLYLIPAGLAQNGSATNPVNPFIPPLLSAKLANKNAVISWPASRIQWDLFEQKPGASDWKLVPADLYHTNAQTISVSIAVGPQPVFYKMRRSLRFVPKAPSVLPPMPTASTNRPPPPAPKQ